MLPQNSVVTTLVDSGVAGVERSEPPAAESWGLAALDPRHPTMTLANGFTTPQRRPLTGGCCNRGSPRSPSGPRRGWEIAAGARSLGVWALMPKCPVCLAAYVALWTGLGLSLAAAAYLRWSLLFLSGVLLLYLAVLTVRRRRVQRDIRGQFDAAGAGDFSPPS